MSAILDLYGAVLVRWFRRWGLDDDSTTKLLVRVIKALPSTVQSYDAKSGSLTFRDWLWIQSRHLALSLPNVAASSIPESYSEDVAPRQVNDDTNRLLRKAVNSIATLLKSDEKAVVKQLFRESRTPTAIAMDMPVTVRTVRNLKHRVLRRLRAEYGAIIGDI
ncbi:MAG: hypothetical protein R3C18_05560 [Planctomycetaceae bacterium]